MQEFFRLQKEQAFLSTKLVMYRQLQESVSSSTNSSSNQGRSNEEVRLGELKQKCSSLDEEIEEAKMKIRVAKLTRAEICQRRKILTSRLNAARLMKLQVKNELNSLNSKKIALKDRQESVLQESKSVSAKLQKYLQMNALNDSFFIWFNGPFATINSFRLGLLPFKNVEFTEINAALGQAALLLHIISSRTNIPLKRYSLNPQGSFSKVTNLSDRRILTLYHDSSSFSLTPKRNFNQGLTGLVTVVYEIGEFILKHDPTLQLPYHINLTDNTIDKILFWWDKDDEVWTRALKFLLSDIKWILAWFTKHFNNTVHVYDS